MTKKLMCLNVLMYINVLKCFPQKTFHFSFIHTVKSSKNMVKTECLYKCLQLRLTNEEGTQSVLCDFEKRKFFSNLLGTQYLFEILNALLTVTNGENVVFDGVP